MDKRIAATTIAASPPNGLSDQRQRPLHDLRISVTDRCNFRCPYCMPADRFPESYAFLARQQHLDFAEIERLVRVFTQLGARKLRLTGGEPLLRRDLPALIERLAVLPGIDDIAMTTNGVLLPRFAQALRGAGLHRVSVSLDTLDAQTFRQLSGGRGDVTDVLAGIDAAERAGFGAIKINCVVVRACNDAQVLPLVEHFRGTSHTLRFIEYMDVGTVNGWRSDAVVPSAELIARIDARWPLVAVAPDARGEVAARYRFHDGAGEIGFISSVSQPFCADCVRARLSADGQLYTCLFASNGLDLRGPLRAGASDHELSALIADRWRRRSDRYSEQRAEFRKHGAQKHVEMFALGG